MNFYKRTLTDVNSMLHHAKQKENEVNSITQIFYYPGELEINEAKNKLRLMVVNEDFINKLENGERFIFKASGEEKLVLCSEDKTYEVKEGEISNSLLLCPTLLFKTDLEKNNENGVEGEKRVLKSQVISGLCHSYLELRPTFPRLQKLQKVLESCAYHGLNEDEKEQGYYLYELLDIIQCSRNELLENLKHLKAFCLEGKWRILSLNYATEVFSYIISLMEKEKWDKIHVSETKRLLSHLVPDYIIDHVLANYAVLCSEDENLYMFNEELVSRCFAELLLKTAEGKFRFNEFIMAWEQCLHPVLEANLNHLKGLALVEKGEGQFKVIHLFPECDLPENISERFRLLFKQKEKWTLDEITPYIERLTTSSQDVNALLTKYTRASNFMGVRLFSARYAK